MKHSHRGLKFFTSLYFENKHYVSFSDRRVSGFLILNDIKLT